MMQITGGDDDLWVNRHASRGNVSVCLDGEAAVSSVPKKSLKAFLHQKIRHLSVGTRYKPMHKLIIGLFQLTLIGCWFSGITLLVIYPQQFHVILPLAFRSILVVLTVHVASARLGHKFEVWPVIFLDFIYAIYYISTGPRALLAKEIRWTN